MIVVIDNYDSFTYNLVQALGEFDRCLTVWRNDRVSVDQVLAAHPDSIVISPGPGRPEEAGIALDLIRTRHACPILGVCLGHQAIGLAFGGNVVRGRRPVHGKTSPVAHGGCGLFAGLPSPIVAGRYHSLVVSDENFPAELEVTARAEDDGAVMAIRHRTRPIVGVQFHPESILTDAGRIVLRNFLAMSSRGTDVRSTAREARPS